MFIEGSFIQLIYQLCHPYQKEKKYKFFSMTLYSFVSRAEKIKNHQFELLFTTFLCKELEEKCSQFFFRKLKINSEKCLTNNLKICISDWLAQYTFNLERGIIFFLKKRETVLILSRGSLEDYILFS